MVLFVEPKVLLADNSVFSFSLWTNMLLTLSLYLNTYFYTVIAFLITLRIKNLFIML